MNDDKQQDGTQADARQAETQSAGDTGNLRDEEIPPLSDDIRDQFVIDAAKKALEILQHMDPNDAQSVKDVRKRVRSILRDIINVMQGETTGDGSDEDPPTCISCQPNFNRCVASGTPYETCLDRYYTCCDTCV